MRRVIALIVAVALLSGCASSASREAGFSNTDINFAEMMIPHHEQAIVMSDLALSNTTNPEILELASAIKSAQAPEIALMSSWPGVDPSAHMGHTMSGMLSGAEIAELESANGAEFDRLFLIGMIKHHEGAIAMAQDVIDSKNEEVAELAKAIIEAQRAEISQMQALLN